MGSGHQEASYQKQLACMATPQPFHSPEPSAKAQAQAALGGGPKFHHYRRSRKHKSPRKRTFVMFMEKIPDGWLGGPATPGAACGDGVNPGGAGGSSTTSLQASQRRRKAGAEEITLLSHATGAGVSMSRSASAASALDPLPASATFALSTATTPSGSPLSSASHLDLDLQEQFDSSALLASFDKYGLNLSAAFAPVIPVALDRPKAEDRPAVSACNSIITPPSPATSRAASTAAPRSAFLGRSAFAPTAFWSLSDDEDITSAVSVPAEAVATARVSVIKSTAATAPVSAFAAISAWGAACSECPSGCSADSATCTSFGSVDWFGGASTGLSSAVKRTAPRICKRGVSPALPAGNAFTAVVRPLSSPRTSSSGGVGDVSGGSSSRNATSQNASPALSPASSFLNPAAQAEAAGDAMMEDSGAVSPQPGEPGEPPEPPARSSSTGAGGARSSSFSIRLAPRFGAAPGTAAPAGRVRCIQMVSAGAYGNVWRGRWRGRDVAVKLPNVAVAGQELSDAEIRASFVNEMEVLSRVSHPHIAPALHMQLEGGPVCIVQEFANWGTLSDYISGHAGRDWAALEALVLARAAQLTASSVEQLLASPLTAAAARAASMSVERYLVLLMLLLDVAEGMKYLESVRVVHRDLKPENVLISDTGAALLSDFGLSAILTPVTAAADGTVLNIPATVMAPEGHGTVQYAAPEDLWPGNYSLATASDVFSFGYCLWEALSGVPPWVGIQTASIMYAVGGQHMRLAVPPAWPAPLRRLIDSAWAKDPVSRPTSVQISAVLEGQLLLAASVTASA